MKDGFGREINYLRVSVTDRCNLRCKYCMPKDGIQLTKHEEILTFEETYKIVKAFVNLGINKVRITGGEPLVRTNIVDLLKKIGTIPEIKDYAMTTNGVLLKKYAGDILNAGIKRLNISIDTLDEKKFSDVTLNANLSQVLEGIKIAKSMDFEKIKLNIVLMGGINDDEIKSFVNMTKNEKIDVRFIELMPMGEATKFPKERFVPVEKVLQVCPELVKAKREDASSPAVYYKFSDGAGKVGLIRPMTCKFCADCNRVRLTATGQLKMCLHDDGEINLRDILRQGKDLEAAILKAIVKKPEEHSMEKQQYTSKNMVQIGG